MTITHPFTQPQPIVPHGTLGVLILDDVRFDLILIDYQLPDSTGPEASKLVHMSALNHNAATIMITGKVQDSIAQKTMKGGCHDGLSKDDFSPPTFSHVVRSAMAQQTL